MKSFFIWHGRNYLTLLIRYFISLYFTYKGGPRRFRSVSRLCFRYTVENHCKPQNSYCSSSQPGSHLINTLLVLDSPYTYYWWAITLWGQMMIPCHRNHPASETQDLSVRLQRCLLSWSCLAWTAIAGSHKFPLSGTYPCHFPSTWLLYMVNTESTASLMQSWYVRIVHFQKQQSCHLTLKRYWLNCQQQMKCHDLKTSGARCQKHYS